jgi:hypothetical protein
MFEICFTKEALEFLLRHAYSPWRFWSNVYKLNSNLVTSPAEEAVPFSLDFVQQRILTTNTPFGLAGSSFSDVHCAKLKALLEVMGGSLDISKLEPKMAFFLMQHGLIMHKTKSNDYREIAELVVNPLWADWLAALTAVPAEAPPTVQAEASPALSAEPSPEPKAAPTA